MMLELPAALSAFAAYRQFVLYKTFPSETRPGKTDKLPCDWRTGKVASAHDPAIWLDSQTAMSLATTWGEPYGVGFVFNEQCPFWFLDIDNCIDAGRYSDTALRIAQLLSGCAIEISQSGSGLHFFGIGQPPRHSCRNDALGLEFYHTGRFAALTGIGAVGSAAHDCSPILPALVAAYFPPDTTSPDVLTEWTDAPVADSSPVADDAELIRRACISQSTASAFGNRASFADLWHANESVLSGAYPDPIRPYDCSAADAALAQHLAFWTGKDCERIRRLMLLSGLVRDKWEREDYLPRTIMGACSRQVDVYAAPESAMTIDIPSAAQEAVSIGEGSGAIPPVEDLSLAVLQERFVYVKEGQQVFDTLYPKHLLSWNDFKAAHKSNRNELDIWAASRERKTVYAITFKAGAALEIKDPEGRQAVNLWRPLNRQGETGDVSLFLEHLKYLFTDDAERFLDWLAHIEQQPGDLPHTGWVHISDRQGTGRNWIGCVLARLWPGYAAVNFDLAGMLHNGFNGRLSQKLIAVVDEIREGGKDARWENSETMKRILTEEYRNLNPKYGRERIEFNSCRWLIFSNSIAALPLDAGDRRFNVVRNDLPPQPPDYYIRLYRALKDPAFIMGIAHLLRARDISSFNPGAHARMNEAKQELISASRSEVDEWLSRVVETWPNDVISTSVLGEIVTGIPNGRLSRSHSHAMERFGIRAYAKTLRNGGSVNRVSILRDATKWKNADSDQIRAELERVPIALQFGVSARLVLEGL